MALWIPYLAVPVGMGLLCLQLLADLWLVITRRSHPFGLPLVMRVVLPILDLRWSRGQFPVGRNKLRFLL